MKVKVKLRLLEIYDELEMELEEDLIVRSLLEKLISIYGDNLKKLIVDPKKGYRAIVIGGGEVIKANEKLKDKSELTLLLPVAGG